MSTDALSNVLRSVRLSGGLFFRVQMRSPYAVAAMPGDEVRARFAPRADHVLPFHIVTGGAIWFGVPGSAPARLEPDDIIVLPRGSIHSLSDEPGREPVPVEALRDSISGVPPTLRHGGRGAESEALCGFFTMGGKLFNPLLKSLPEVMVIRADSNRTSWLSATFRKAFDEMSSDRPGRHAMVERLTETLFLDVIQAHLEAEAPRGWLRGLSDPLVARALDRLHAEPSRAWTVDALAREVSTSRSVLTERFGATVGLSPMRYLSAWRIELAAGRLAETDDGIADIAADVGYESEAAFNRAFKRHVGVPPARWRRQTSA